MEGTLRYYRFEGFQLDTLRRELRDSEGALVPLTSKAFDVLCTLIESREIVVGKDALLLAVWPGRVVEENNLTQAIVALRRAFGASAHDRRFIVTVPGRGYRFAGVLEDAGQAPPPPACGIPPRATEPDASVRSEPSRLPAPESPASPLPSPLPSPVPESEALPRHRRRLWWIGAALLVALVAAGWVLWPRAPAQGPVAGALPATSRGSIAVLPLANVGQDQSQQFFSDGISENLIGALSNYEGLKVVGRSSSFRFRDSHEDSRSIGAKLGVSYLVSGSVQRANDHVRVAVEVVDTADGQTLLTQRFDRPYRNLFALQDEIALAVAGALLGKLPHIHSMVGVVETGRPASGNLEAYSAFLRGAQAMLGNTQRAIAHFSEATQLDPQYAQAWQWQGFARAISARYLEEGEALSAACARARAEIETAIRLAPEQGLGYTALAVQRTSCDYDWNGALALYRRAMPMVPVSSPAHAQYSRLLATLGRVNEAIDERYRQLAGDPLTRDGYFWLFQMQAALGRLGDAQASLQRLVELTDPDDAGGYSREQSYLSILRGDADAALAQARLIPPSSERDLALALALQGTGNDGEAAAALQRLLKNTGNSKGGAYGIARVYALRGDADAMFEWLNRDWDRHGVAVYQLLLDPLLLRFRKDPRFAAFCHKTGLPPPTASEALGIDEIRAANADRR